MASNEAASLNATVHAKQDKLAPNSVSVAVERDVPLKDVPIRAPGVRDEQFPTADLSAADPHDAVMKAKLDLQSPETGMGVTPFGKLIAKDSDFEWLQKKQAAAVSLYCPYVLLFYTHIWLTGSCKFPKSKFIVFFSVKREVAWRL